MANEKRLSSKLRPASFRGVPFDVESAELSAGRRKQLHEYPQRDKPYVDDLGRATREIPITAFVVGEDYVERAQALIGAFEEPGPGALIHPWLGEMTVSLQEKARVVFDRDLGQARISVVFIESGELTFPSSATSTQAASRRAAQRLEVAAQQSFAERFGVKGFQDFVTAAATGNLGNMLGVVSSSDIGKVLGFANSMARTISTAISLVSSPDRLGWTILGAFGLSGLATTRAAWSNIARQLSRFGTSRSLRTPTASRVHTPSRRRCDRNAAAVYDLGRQGLLAQAVGISSLVGTALDTTARPVVDHDTILGVRDDLLAALDQEMLTADDTAYDALADARNAVWDDLTARASDRARLATMTPTDVLPALVLAYEQYEDAARDLELVARNAIRHPGFVPAEPLKVLTR